jgi:hypothetical protein
MKKHKKIILIICKLLFVLFGCGNVDGPCVDYIILNIKSPEGVSIGSYSGEFLQNGKLISSFYCEHDQTLSQNYKNSGSSSCGGENSLTIPEGLFSRNGMITSFDVVVYSFNKEMKSQTHFDLEFKYPRIDKVEGCEVKTIEVILK